MNAWQSDIGEADQAAVAAFEVVSADEPATPLVFASPHSGRLYPEEMLEAAAIHDPEYIDSLPAEARHPLVRRHAITGVPALLLHQATLARIEGVAEPESREVLGALYEAVERSASRVRHRWAENDVLLWDNRSVLHRAEHTPAGVTKVTWRALVTHVSDELIVSG